MPPIRPVPCTAGHRRRRTHRGFTLVEVLVALLVMAVLSTMAWQGVAVIARTQDSTREAVDRVLRTNTVIAQWEQDLKAVQEAPAVPAISFDGATIRLTRQTEQGLQLVVWRLHDGRWDRWTAPPTTRQAELQEHWMRSQQLTGDEPGTLRTLTDVTAIQLFFYLRNGWASAQSSGDLTPRPGTGDVPQGRQFDLPDAVRLVLTLGEHTLSRDTLLWPQPQ